MIAGGKRKLVILLATLLIFSISAISHSQETIDQLEKKLASQTGQEQIRTLLELGRLRATFFPRAALRYLEQIVQLTADNKWPELLAESWLIQSEACHVLERPDDALVLITKAVDYYEKNRGSSGYFKSLTARINHYYRLRKFPEAKRLLDGIESDFNDTDSEFLSVAGLVERASGNTEIADKYFEDALKYAKDKTQKARIYQRLGAYYSSRSSFEDSLIYVVKAKELFDEEDEELYGNDCEYRRLAILRQLEHGTDGLEKFEQLARYFRKSNALISLAKVLNELSISYREYGKYDEALIRLLEVEKIAYELKMPELLARALFTISNLYFAINDFEEAIVYSKKAIEVMEDIGDEFLLTYAENQLGSLYKNTAQYDLAQKYLARSAERAKQQNLIHVLLTNLLQSSIIDSELGNFISSQDKLLEAQKVASDYEISGNAGLQIQKALAITFSKLDKRQDALKALERLESLVDEISSETNINHLLEAKSTIYEDLGNYQLALSSYKELVERREKLNNEESRKQINDLQVQYDTVQKEREIELLKEREQVKNLELSQQKMISGSITIGLILIAMLAASIFMAYRIKAKALKREEELSRKDPLTQLMNRRAMNETVGLELNRFERSKSAFSLVITDIDHFKKFNDTHGHECGDEVLKMVSSALNESVRKQDRVARWGGEEFLLMLPETDESGAMLVAEKVRAAIESSTLEYSSQALSVTMSFGICQFTEEMSVDGCLNYADEALYDAKENGRNRVHSYSGK
jgi:diguanylate cyclase (GGDEF)-like protein